MPTRSLPNIAISGTPGVGKSTLCKNLSSALPSLTIIDIGAEAKTHSYRTEYDESLSCWVIDEEKLAKKLTPSLQQEGGKIIDYMHAAIWPAAAPVDLVVTVRCTNTTILWDRYKERNYKAKKVEQNIDCEIMGDIEGENREWFGMEDGVEEGTAAWAVLESGSDEEMEANVKKIVEWVEKWKQKREEVGESEEMDVVPFGADGADGERRKVTQGESDDDDEEDDREAGNEEQEWSGLSEDER